ncbi:UTRA domain-containing protein [Streptomyces durbertensis]|uniref:UTRA domain-containing protein n=1 Tax=Streptomyces durbertensis TaxID=2448886 RepID=A0ABR6ENR0_9ACTN|nr:UTRA domain-containing protein [Streptomyces durbertensis]MBB1246987.1 UTRA domain-containing protein [Streptomyces durbertensis]
MGEWVSSSRPYLTARSSGHGDPWSTEAGARGRRGTQRVTHAGLVPAPSEIATLLGTPEGGDVIARRRIMFLDDLPFELTDTYYPTRIAAGTRLAETAKIPGGAIALLAELGHVGVRVSEDVSARMPTEDEREALRTSTTEPVLQLTRVTLDEADQPIQVDRMVMPAHRQRLRYELRID